MKIFGKELFNFKKKEDNLWDFAQFGSMDFERPSSIMEFTTSTVADDGSKKVSKKQVAKKKPLTAKQIYKAGGLNDNSFTINVDPAYIDAQVAFVDEKLGLYPVAKKVKKGSRESNDFFINSEVGSVKYGREELNSIKERLLNRKSIKRVREIIEKYPHTTGALIEKVLKENSGLSCRKHDQFIPEYPKDAVASMKEYNNMCMDICGKKTNFYVVASYKDFQKANSRRDPILLAQSPFGFFWQVLGAWDEEMVYLGDL